MTRGRPNPRYWTLPQRLRRARKAVGLSCSALSVAAGVGRCAATMIENGIRIPRLPMIEQLACVLGLSPSRLAFGFELPVDPYEGTRSAGFAARLKEARSLRDVTVRELGRASGVVEGTVRAMERGTMPQVDTVEAVSKALGVSPAWLAFGEGPREFVRRGKLEVAQPLKKQRPTQSPGSASRLATEAARGE